MDKFGIFKLLNSFFNFYEQNKGNFNSNSSPVKTDTPNPLNSILNSINNKIQQEQPKQEKITQQAIPLQSSMLSTMNSHDEFIKRVKEKHGTN